MQGNCAAAVDRRLTEWDVAIGAGRRRTQDGRLLIATATKSRGGNLAGAADGANRQFTSHGSHTIAIRERP